MRPGARGPGSGLGKVTSTDSRINWGSSFASNASWKMASSLGASCRENVEYNSMGKPLCPGALFLARR